MEALEWKKKTKLRILQSNQQEIITKQYKNRQTNQALDTEQTNTIGQLTNGMIDVKAEQKKGTWPNINKSTQRTMNTGNCAVL